MAVLVIAEHDNATLKPATLNTVTAARQLSDAGAGDVTAMTLVPPSRPGSYAHPRAALAAAAAADLTIVATSMAFPRAYDDMTETILGAGKRLVLHIQRDPVTKPAVSNHQPISAVKDQFINAVVI